MKKIKIVADSSANVLTLNKIPFAAAPMKVITDAREFVDDAALDVEEMVAWFDTCKGRSKTSCPAPADWLDAFCDAEEVYCVTITSGLSGSYNSACVAKQMYEAEHEGRRVCVIDSLSAGPELMLIIEKLEQYIEQGMAYEEICKSIEAYKQETGLVFMLQSLKNFAANGRVSPTVAKLAGVLGIRIVGKAGDRGTLEPMHKCRGEERSLAAILSYLKSSGLSKGKVRIAHCRNEAAARKLKDMILSQMGQADVRIHRCKGLCSYYAETGGLLVGFERG
ncbi:MAG: DegV family protein [Oscillospiraceae bacterium]|nr:DegV family protein [Oscillospiraceae bacterium]